MKRCMACMNTYEDELEVCPHCGYAEGTMPEESIHMIPGTILHERYIIGKVAGYGGFGVTYIAWDSLLEHRVAVKEYLPSEFSTRMPGKGELTIFSGNKAEQFSAGMSKFLEEARRLAKFDNEDGIVKIYDCFEENKTAYIIMEYLEGITIGEYLEKSGPIPPDDAIRMMMPIMNSLKAVHKEGIIHRDIAPDNIMVTGQGQIKLIDFGAARYATTSHSRSLTVIIKPGYSPEEQYRSRGDQGTHTDVYAVGAVLYKMITGITPPDSMERRAKYENGEKDILEPIHKFNNNISENTENAILNAMNIRIEDRTPDMDTFIRELTSKEPVVRRNGKIKKIDILKWPIGIKIGVATVFAAVVTLLVLFVTGVIGFKKHSPRDIDIPDGMTRIPQIVNMDEGRASEILSEKQLEYIVQGKRHDEQIQEGCVLSQSTSVGSVVPINYQLGVVISSGIEQIEVPYIIGYSEERGIAELEECGFTYEIINEFDSVIEEGHISAQSVPGGTEEKYGSSIIITVSLGRNPDIKYDFSGNTMPGLIGMELDDAKAVCEQYGIKLIVSEYEYSEIYNPLTILDQKIEEGSEVQNDIVVEVVLSKGAHVYKVPDVVYMEEADAIARLEKNEIKYDISYEENDNVTAGCVISQSIGGGTVIDKDEIVSIVISSGPRRFDMINVVGNDEKTALESLRNIGLIVTKEYRYSDEYEAGTVLEQSVEEGAPVYKGYEVIITICSEEELVDVPDIVGWKYEDAVKSLQEQGFKINKNEIYDANIESGFVISQTPAANSKQPKGSSIVLTVSLGKEPVKVTLDANGGKIDNNSITVYYTDTYGELPIPTRNNCKFTGWYTAKDSGTKIDKLTKVNINVGHTLYAHWERNIVKVTYDYNDGATPSVSNVVYVGDKYTVTEPTREYYEFLGWYTSKDGGELVTSKTEITNGTNHTLYARWKVKTVTVTYDPCSGNLSGSRTITYELGSTYKENAATRSGYTFMGWYTKENGEGTRIVETTKVINEKDHTLYAFWSNSPVKIKFDSMGGNSVNSINVVYDKAYGTLPTVSKSGYIFKGWYTEKTGGINITENSKVSVTGEQTLYAHWEAATYTVTFDACGGSCGTNNKTVKYSETYGTLPTPTRTGYTFGGWYTSSSGGTEITSESTVNTAANQTLYAHWEAATYMVTFDACGGSCGTNNKTVKYSETYGTLPTPTRTGYTFGGWYTSSSGGTEITSESTVNTAANQTLYAHWTSNTYTVIYNGNGSTGGSTGNTNHIYDVAGNLAANGYSKTGYNFTGWNTKSDGTGTTYSNSQSVKNLATGGQVTLYAMWTEKEHIYGYDLSKGDLSFGNYYYEPSCSVGSDLHLTFRTKDTVSDGQLFVSYVNGDNYYFALGISNGYLCLKTRYGSTTTSYNINYALSPNTTYTFAIAPTHKTGKSSFFWLQKEGVEVINGNTDIQVFADFVGSTSTFVGGTTHRIGWSNPADVYLLRMYGYHFAKAVDDFITYELYFDGSTCLNKYSGAFSFTGGSASKIYL
ncbi:MAG: InlB B-repeat-containing protein [Butyrivibrio sp.]